MALTQCPKCGGPISDSVVTCPYCDYEMSVYMDQIRKQEKERRKAEEEVLKLQEKKRQEDEHRREQTLPEYTIYYRPFIARNTAVALTEYIHANTREEAINKFQQHNSGTLLTVKNGHQE